MVFVCPSKKEKRFIGGKRFYRPRGVAVSLAFCDFIIKGGKSRLSRGRQVSLSCSLGGSVRHGGGVSCKYRVLIAKAVPDK